MPSARAADLFASAAPRELKAIAGAPVKLERAQIHLTGDGPAAQRTPAGVRVQ